MRFGWILSLIAHVLAVTLTLVTWPMAATHAFDPGNVVPVEIVTLAPVTSVSPIASQEEESVADTAAQETPPEPEAAAAPEQRRPSLSDYLDEVQGSLLEDKSKTKAKSAPRQREGRRGDRPRAAAGLGAAEQAALEDQLRALMRDHMRRNRCWRAPVDLDLSNPQRLIVTVRVRLDARGRVLGSPQLVSPATTFGVDPHLRAAAQAAVRAILECDPYPFPNYSWAAEHYDVWRDMEFVFDPSQLSG